MKVLLLFKPNTPIMNTQQNVIPNGLLYIGAFLLSKGIDTEVLNLSNKTWDECKLVIGEKKPDVVGISCYTFNRNTCITLAKLVKEIDQKIKIIFGGPHPSVMHEQLLRNFCDIDIIVLKEGEITFFNIIKRLKEGKEFENLPGIIYRNQDEIINNGFRNVLENLDELPIPARYFKYKRIVTSRGCPGKCIFCDTPCLWGQRVMFRSAANVVDELEMLNKKYGLSSFIISDDTFTFDKDRTINICKEIIKRNLKITWDCRSRANFICEERLRWMKKAGCTIISYGIESGSQKILDTLKKGIKVEQIKKVAALTRKFGFNLNYFIIVGSPCETDDTIRETMNLIEETKPTSVFTYIMQLTPGTEIYEMAKEQGFINDNDWLNKEYEAIFYTQEKSIKELTRYARLINELSRVFKDRFEYTEEELKDVMKEIKGVQDLINLAHIKIKERKLDEAENTLNEAIGLNHGSSEAFMNKAILLAIKQDETCVDLFNKSIELDPENLLAYKNFGLFLYQKKRYDEAINIFKSAIEVEPADVEFYNNIGSIYGVQEKYDESINTFEKALSIEPNNKDTLRNLELTYGKKGNIGKVEEIRKKFSAV